MFRVRRSTLSALALCIAPLALQAQSECDLDSKGSSELRSAQLSILKASAGRPSERVSAIRSAVKTLSEKAERIKDTVARDRLLGQALAMYFADTTHADVVVRGDVGFVSNPSGTVDLVVHVDSLFDVVEQAKPGCVAETTPYRELMSSRMYRHAVQYYNRPNYDSAVIVLNRTAIIDARSPDIPNVLAIIAQQRRDYDGAIREYEKVIALSGTDTATAKMRAGARAALGELLVYQAERAPAAEKAALYRKAAMHLSATVKEDRSNVAAKARLATTLIESGDTAAATGLFAEMVASASSLTDLQLFEAGVAAARANRTADATKLFEAGLTQNPYLRDGLYNAAIMYVALEDAEKLLGVTRRLVEVDPNNEDNWRLLASVYHMRQKGTKDAKVKKAMTDSLVTYMTRAQSLPAQISFTNFSHNGASHTVEGRLENRTKVSKSFTIKFEFLDTAGKAIASQEANVGPVAAGETKTFKVSVEQAGVVAFRYVPVT